MLALADIADIGESEFLQNLKAFTFVTHTQSGTCIEPVT